MRQNKKQRKSTQPNDSSLKSEKITESHLSYIKIKKIQVTNIQTEQDTTDTTYIEKKQNIQLYFNKFDNLDKMGTFVEG